MFLNLHVYGQCHLSDLVVNVSMLFDCLCVCFDSTCIFVLFVNSAKCTCPSQASVHFECCVNV